MRYQEAQPHGPVYARSEGLHDMLLFTVCIALIVGVVLLALAVRARVIWLISWSAMLVLASLAYLGSDLLGLL